MVQENSLLYSLCLFCALAVLVASTPQAFRIALSETEIWAVLTAEKEESISPNFTDLDGQSHGNLTEPHKHNKNSVQNVGNEHKTSSNFMKSFRNMRMQFQSNQIDGNNDDAVLSRYGDSESTWPHDRKDGRTVCLWSDASEVLTVSYCTLPSNANTIIVDAIFPYYICNNCGFYLQEMYCILNFVYKVRIIRCCKYRKRSPQSAAVSYHILIISLIFMAILEIQ